MNWTHTHTFLPTISDLFPFRCCRFDCRSSVSIYVYQLCIRPSGLDAVWALFAVTTASCEYISAFPRSLWGRGSEMGFGTFQKSRPLSTWTRCLFPMFTMSVTPDEYRTYLGCAYRCLVLDVTIRSPPIRPSGYSELWSVLSVLFVRTPY